MKEKQVKGEEGDDPLICLSGRGFGGIRMADWTRWKRVCVWAIDLDRTCMDCETFRCASLRAAMPLLQL